MMRIETRKEIEKMLDDLIIRAQDITEETEIVQHGMKPAQLRNILEVASSTNSIKAVEVFIQYQMGRKETQKAWAKSRFGRRLLEEEIPALERRAEEISKKTGDDKKSILMEILRLYLGYLNRYFIYLNSISSLRGEGT